MKLALGTVQFGLDYGISNSQGQSSRAEVSEILQLAQQEGIDLLDTAPGYGDAEAIVGEAISTLPNMNVMTKVSALTENPSEIIGSSVEEAFNKSCERLGRNSLYCLMVHRCQDLLGPNGPALADAMVSLKNQGRVERIGISTHDVDQAKLVARRFPIDLVQMPLNVLDQRLLSSTVFEDFQRANIELHVRSVFLQGVLLMSPAELPDFLNPLTETLVAFHAMLKLTGLSMLAGALAFARQQEALSRIIVGVASKRQLEGLLTAYSEAENCEVDFSEFARQEEILINPGKWPNAWPPIQFKK
jgi:aryl-alcohol dehydrogenase-like predicted oxidoreductase